MRVAVHDEADELFAHLVVSVARRRGHLAQQVADIDEIGDALDGEPAAILLGVGRLDDDALAQVATLRSTYQDALIFLAAEDAGAGAAIAALEHGATDVVHKPVLPKELVLRAELAAPKHMRDERAERAIRVGDIEVDIDQVRAIKANRELVLTRMELRLLYCLMQHHGRVAPTERLLTFGWESEELAASSLKTHISHLRRKLADAGGMPVRIKSRQMLGYSLEIAEAA